MKPPPEIAKHGITRIVHNLGDQRLDVGGIFARIFQDELIEFLQQRGHCHESAETAVSADETVDREPTNVRGLGDLGLAGQGDATEGDALSRFVEMLEADGRQHAARGGKAK